MQILTHLEVFETIVVLDENDTAADSLSPIIDRLSSFDCVLMENPDDELIFLGSTGVPWVIVVNDRYPYQFIPAERILVYPHFRFPGDEKALRHFKKMVQQSIARV